MTPDQIASRLRTYTAAFSGDDGCRAILCLLRSLASDIEADAKTEEEARERAQQEQTRLVNQRLDPVRKLAPEDREDLAKKLRELTGGAQGRVDVLKDGVVLEDGVVLSEDPNLPPWLCRYRFSQSRIHEEDIPAPIPTSGLNFPFIVDTTPPSTLPADDAPPPVIMKPGMTVTLGVKGGPVYQSTSAIAPARPPIDL